MLEDQAETFFFLQCELRPPCFYGFELISGSLCFGSWLCAPHSLCVHTCSRRLVLYAVIYMLKLSTLAKLFADGGASSGSHESKKKEAPNWWWRRLVSFVVCCYVIHEWLANRKWGRGPSHYMDLIGTSFLCKLSAVTVTSPRLESLT